MAEKDLIIHWVCPLSLYFLFFYNWFFLDIILNLPNISDYYQYNKLREIYTVNYTGFQYL